MQEMRKGHLRQTSQAPGKAWRQGGDRKLNQVEAQAGTFAATFLLATLAALELEGMRLEDL